VREAARLTELQLAVLDVLWDEGEATTQDVWSRVVMERPLALTTVATILSRLERKNVLRHRREGRQYVYRATVTRHEVRRSKIRALTDALFGGDPVELLGHVAETNGVDADGMRRIRRILDEAAVG
jgi:predicted transcriptional regulator